MPARSGRPAGLGRARSGRGRSSSHSHLGESFLLVPEPPHVQNHPLLSNYSSADKSTRHQPGGSSRLRCSRVPAPRVLQAAERGTAQHEKQVGRNLGENPLKASP